MHQKLAPDPFLFLPNNSKQTLHAGKLFWKSEIWKMIIKKPLKSQLYIFFQIQCLLMSKVIKNKKGLELVTSHFSGYKKRSEKFLCLLYITWPSLNKPSLFHFHLSFWIWIVWKRREKITKNLISPEQKELFRWNKKHLS